MKNAEIHMHVTVIDLGDAQQVARLEDGIEQGGGLITFFSDEWVERRAACEAFVRAREGRFERRLGARKCAVREVPRGEAAAFLDAYHLQGRSRLSLIAFGLYDGAELLGVLSLGNHHRKIEHRWIVLDRLCFLDGVQIIGGTSRLFDRACQWARAHQYDAVISFSDNRLTPGLVYERLGFDRKQAYRPDYFYVRDGKRISKQSQRKSHTACPLNMTEWEWAKLRGLQRVYDAGKICWIYYFDRTIPTLERQANSERVAKLHEQGVFKNAHMRGYFKSQKSVGDVYFGSSYELRCLFELEKMESVRNVRRCEAFQAPSGRWRNPDLWVEFADGHVEIWEVKPSMFVRNAEVQDQIFDTMSYAMDRGVHMRVWTEMDSELRTCNSIMKWARNYLAEQQGDTSHVDREKSIRKAIRERHYKKEQAASVVVHCDYCQADHTVLPRTYARNVAKHDGAYVCEAMAGHIGGSKPKDHLKVTNPYAVEGKKKCSRCGEVREMTEFDRRMRSWDGLNATCKRCASAYNAAKYQQRKHANLGSPVEEIACDLHGA